MDRTKAKLVREAVEKALASLDPALNVSVEVGGGRFSDTEVTIKVIVLDKDSGASSKIESDYNKYARMYGLNAKVGDTFKTRGEVFTIVGLKPRSRKYPIIGKRADGKQFKFSPDDVIVATILK